MVTTCSAHLGLYPCMWWGGEASFEFAFFPLFFIYLFLNFSSPSFCCRLIVQVP